MFKLAVPLLLACLLCACVQKQNKTSIFANSNTKKPYVVMVSFDGFRWDYPNLRAVANAGVSAELVPCFPTKTFPNHYSIATGLYPDHHGIVQNTFYAPDLKREYTMGSQSAVENGAFYGGEPIWVTAEKQNVRTASFYWVGSEARIKGFRPTYWKTYKCKIAEKSRIDTLL
jgi:alkaline phosphatase D